MKKTIKLTAIYAIYLAAILMVVVLLVPKNNSLNVRNFSSLDDANSVEKVTNGTPITALSDNKKYIILTFDDGWSSQYKVFKKIQPLKGTLYICSGLIGKKDRLTLDNLKEMYNGGWDICNHTVHHINLTKASIQKAFDEVYGCSSWITGHGFKRDMAYKHFAYPEGGYSQDLKEMLKRQGMLTARTTNAGNDTSDLLELGRTSLHGMTKKNIRDYIFSDRKLIILSLHRIIEDGADNVEEIDLKESYFNEVMSSIYESNRQIITLTQWYKSTAANGFKKN